MPQAPSTTSHSPVLGKGTWSQEEHERFLDAMADFISWEDVARRVGTRSRLQCRTHNQKIEKRMANVRRSGGRASQRVEHRLPETLETRPPPDVTKLESSPVALKNPISPPGVDSGIALGGNDFDMNLSMDVDDLGAPVVQPGTLPESAFPQLDALRSALDDVDGPPLPSTDILFDMLFDPSMPDFLAYSTPDPSEDPSKTA